MEVLSIEYLKQNMFGAKKQIIIRMSSYKKAKYACIFYEYSLVYR